MAIDYTAPNGLVIVKIGGDDNFQTRVTRSLDKIGQTTAGQALFSGLMANRNNRKYCTIHPATGSCCECMSDSDKSRTKLAQSIFDYTDRFPAELSACIQVPSANLTIDSLATKINATPVYDIRGLPNTAPSQLNVTGDHIRDWIMGVTEFPAPFTNVNADKLVRVLLTALWPAARTRPGEGGHARVKWNENSASIGLTTGVRQVRSKSIGLAHELVHAYYTGRGLQMGLDNPEPLDGVPTVTSAALYEYMCVGLGIWSDEPISENKIRDQWRSVTKNTLLNGSVKVSYGETALRPCY